MLFIFALVFCAIVQIQGFQNPPPTYEAKDYTTWYGTSGNSRVGSISIPAGDSDTINLYRLDLVGDAYTRGFDHGALLYREIQEFTGPKLDVYLADMILDINLSGLPPQIVDKALAAQKALGAAAPKIFREAMSWVWDNEEEFVPQYIKDELDGIADGVCSKLIGRCNATDWALTLKQLNMLPELIRMACTMFGAYGEAVPVGSNTLVQLRALDFGGGPFANYTVVQVHRDPNSFQEFVSISFPGFAGVITGIASKGIGISEKVWMDYSKGFSTAPGSYKGEADVLVLRRILEFAKNRNDAEAMLSASNRTWGMWVGIGDYDTMVFETNVYKQAQNIPYNDDTVSSQTGQPPMKNLVYVDKHPQPSGDGPFGSLPTVLKAYYGNITLDSAKIITQYHGSGDLHIAIYDYAKQIMDISVGRVNSDGNYGPEGVGGSVWEAHNRPYIRFNLPDLWNGV